MQITEIFYSIQGEGILTGIPTVFIRTTGCNLRCSYCDTTYAYQGGRKMSIDEILLEISTYQCNHICITGGEPLLQEETKQLIRQLQEKNFEISLETNGSQSLQSFTTRNHLMISMDIKTPSSTMQNNNLFDNIELLTQNDQLKCIIQNEEDYTYAKKMIEQYKPNCPVIFQPAWGSETTDLASWILHDHLPVRFGIQLHKILWGAKTHR